MTVLAYDSTFLFTDPTFRRGYRLFTGQVDLNLSDNAEISIGQILADELATLPVVDSSVWLYQYVWKAYIFQDASNADLLKTFASIPNRYDFGHLTVGTVTGIVWDNILKFEDQVTPLFRATFTSENPQPGDGFPFGTVGLGESALNVWAADGGSQVVFGYTECRGSFLNVFVKRPAPYIVRVAYTAQFGFDEFNIAGVLPEPFVQVYP